MDKKQKPNSGNESDANVENARHRYRMRHEWQDLIEEKIQEGKDKGIFDNLPGKGKPLNLSRNLYAPDKELAYGLLKENDLTPAWIMSRNEIIKKRDALREEMAKVWMRHEREYRVVHDVRFRDGLALSWDNACQRWQVAIIELNKLIRNYNLKRPIDNLEIIQLELTRELGRINAPRWLRQLNNET